MSFAGTTTSGTGSFHPFPHAARMVTLAKRCCVTTFDTSAAGLVRGQGRPRAREYLNSTVAIYLHCHPPSLPFYSTSEVSSSLFYAVSFSFGSSYAASSVVYQNERGAYAPSSVYSVPNEDRRTRSCCSRQALRMRHRALG